MEDHKEWQAQEFQTEKPWDYWWKTPKKIPTSDLWTYVTGTSVIRWVVAGCSLLVKIALKKFNLRFHRRGDQKENNIFKYLPKLWVSRYYNYGWIYESPELILLKQGEKKQETPSLPEAENPVLAGGRVY